MCDEESTPGTSSKPPSSEYGGGANETQREACAAIIDDDGATEMEDGEEDYEEEGGDENLDTTAAIGEEDRDEEGPNEDGSTQAWEPNQDNFNDFQFQPDGDSLESGLINTVEELETRLAGLWAEGDKIVTAKIDKNRRFVCIDYPCVVQNVDRALATLEGPKAISKVLSENGRMPLYFRPDDCFSKPVYANCTHSQNLLVRVRRRKKKRPASERSVEKASVADVATSASGASAAEACDDYEYQLVVDGIVDRMYSFDGMCDFQYLPVVRNQPRSKSAATGSGGDSYSEILSRIVPDFEDDREEYLSREMQLFLPPLIFSRRQLPVTFQFEDDQPSKKKSDVIETERKNRFLGSIHVTFDHPGVPVETHPDAPLYLGKLPVNQQQAGLEAVQKLFEERPLWTRAGLQVNMEPAYRQYIKFLVPMVAYYFTNGAWKSLWCKLGYDPRKEVAAKLYQTVDFRIRKLVNRSKVDGKRAQYYRGVFRFNTDTPKMPSLDNASSEVQYVSNMCATYEARNTAKAVKELVYVYRQGMMPPFRQMRYQACDIHHPEIQAKLHENDGKETVCTERDGWCVPDFTDICRDILHREVEKLQAAQSQ
ncbi:hypothetical protein EGW08_011801 [Elysia chlorotica]|uniref:Transcription factor IIIC subunit 5 HTH domain-containing protein n=1 Tax=Elysia chlorotica TaxID=188477 RepID=A0A433TFT7_ELYCH|nr:hypothetical protein EGW08_011801 [Elysia chlorotica]